MYQCAILIYFNLSIKKMTKKEKNEKQNEGKRGKK